MFPHHGWNGSILRWAIQYTDLEIVKYTSWVPLEQDYSDSNALAMELLQSCTKPLRYETKSLCLNDCPSAGEVFLNDMGKARQYHTKPIKVQTKHTFPSMSYSDRLCCQSVDSLQWRHNGHDGISNHQPHDCLLSRLFRNRSKKTSKLSVTGQWPVNSPHKWSVTRKMFPFDDVIMSGTGT